MKKARKYELLFVAFCAAGACIYAASDMMGSLAPNQWSVGMCVQGKRTGRSYRFIEDTYSGPLDNGVPARVLDPGVPGPGVPEAGTVERLNVDDPSLKLIPCPSDK